MLKNLSDYGIFKDNPSARIIINMKLQPAAKGKNKYNVGMVRRIEEETGVVAADFRDGSDTGSEMQYVGVSRA